MFNKGFFFVIYECLLVFVGHLIVNETWCLASITQEQKIFLPLI